MIRDLTKSGEAAEILSVTKEEIMDSIVSRLDGLDIAEEDKDALRRTLYLAFSEVPRCRVLTKGAATCGPGCDKSPFASGEEVCFLSFRVCGRRAYDDDGGVPVFIFPHVCKMRLASVSKNVKAESFKW